MSVFLGAGGKVLVGPGGKVADSSDCCCGGGACCNGSVCSPSASRAACEAGGGVYLGDGTDCMPVDCTCCAILTPYTTMTFSGQVLGCATGTVNLPTKTWSRVPGGPGCSLVVYTWSIGTNCLCQFQARDCFPPTETDTIFIDQTGDCDDPNYGACLFAAEFSCNDQTVLFGGSTDGFVCCSGSNASVSSSTYPIGPGTIDVTLPSSSGDPSISFRFVLTLS